MAGVAAVVGVAETDEVGVEALAVVDHRLGGVGAHVGGVGRAGAAQSRARGDGRCSGLGRTRGFLADRGCGRMGVFHTIVGDVTEVVIVDVLPRKQEHALETREAGKEVTPVGNRSSSSVRPSGYTDRVMVDVDVTILHQEDGMLESG